ncbi:MAG: hypothetical protein Q4D98_06255 [Planctomycetia bacterium]|nr:hypothetical protein [Planctomycetia bacterium]
MRRATRLLSLYGATESSDENPYHEMVAEARAEVLSKGKLARPFARSVYLKLMELKKEAEI